MFTQEFPLVVNQEIMDYFHTACRLHCNIYNSIVAEAHRRIRAYRMSADY